MHSKTIKQHYWIVALTAILPRFLFIFLAPETVGDGKIYSTVAENILNGCGVSLSKPDSGECVPHFGGNHGPGYPAFIAGIWWLSGHSDLAVRLAQGTIYVVTLVYLVYAIRHYTSSPKLALFTGLFLALSPLQVAWPRYIFTETLALAGTLWLFAELIRSFHQSKLRVIPIGIALIATTFIRLDGILLAIPVAIAGFIIHRPVDAIRKGMVIALILGLPWGGWVLRNIDVGLENIYRPPALSYNEVGKGYSSWGKTWAINQYQYVAIQWPMANRRYETIRVDESAYRTENEKKRVQALLEELNNHTGKPFPKHIDDQFANLAKERINADPLTYYILNPIKRIWSLWSNIYDSFGWPISLDKLSAEDRLEISRGGIESKLLLLKKYPMQTLGKIFVNGWRILFCLFFIATIVLVYKDNDFPYRDLLALALSFVIARSVFSGLANLVETRYTLMQMPIIELVVILIFAQTIVRLKSRKSFLKN